MAVETFEPLTVSHVERLEWDSESEDLTVTFDGGDQYMARNVPRATYRAMTVAESVGSFWHRQIKGRFMVERV